MKDNSFKLLSICLLFIFYGCSSFDSSIKHKDSALHLAVKLGQIKNVELIIPNSNVNIKDSFNDTPIIDAVRNDSIEITKLLICYGADTKVKDNNNNTILDIAVKNNNTEIVKMITHLSTIKCKNNKKNIVPIKKKIQSNENNTTTKKDISIMDTNNTHIAKSVISIDDKDITIKTKYKHSDEAFNELLSTDELNSYK